MKERHFWVNLYDGQMGFRTKSLVFTLNWDFGVWKLGVRLEARTCSCQFHASMYERFCLNIAVGPFSTELTIGERVLLKREPEKEE